MFGILTRILSSLFGSYESWLQIWVFYVECEDAKNSHVLIALNWDLGMDFNKFVWVPGIFVTNSGLFVLSLKVQRTLMSLLPCIGAVDDAGGS